MKHQSIKNHKSITEKVFSDEGDKEPAQSSRLDKKSAFSSKFRLLYLPHNNAPELFTEPHARNLLNIYSLGIVKVNSR